MIAQVLKRGLLVVAVLGMVFAMAPVSAIAQPVVPEAGTCNGPARTPEEIAALQPGEGTPYVSRERERVQRVGEASAEEIEAIAKTVAGWFACVQADDVNRAAVFLTDAAISGGIISLDAGDEVEPITEIEFLGVFGAWTLSDGRIAALIAADDSGQNYPVSSLVLIFANVDNVWLIDDVSF